MSASHAQAQAAQGGRRFRWRIVPAVVLSSFGLLFIAFGLFAARNLWGQRENFPFHMLAYACLVLVGFTWIQAALALMRAQWLLGLSSALIGLVIYCVSAALQFEEFRIAKYWSAVALAAERRAAESAASPFGPNAESILEVALSAAKQQDKRILLHMGGPQCSACRVLDEFLDENMGLFKDDYIIVNIDSSRTRGGPGVESRLRRGREGGDPWIVILDADGRELISSDGPRGNIGYPAGPEEIDHFISMIEKTKKRTSDQQIAAIAKALQEQRAKRGKR